MYAMPVKFQYASDLHLEFPENKAFLKKCPLQPVGEVLVLAGDILPFIFIDKYKDFFNYVSDNFEVTYWLPGNHEYYHYDIGMKSGILNEKIRDNVFLVNNLSVVHKNTRLLFSTLWSRISEGNGWQIERSMNDFRLIKHNGFRFSFEQYNALHKDCIAFIQNELKIAVEENIAVFTHHLPTFMNYPEQYKGDVLNEAFAVELHNFIESSNIACWAYGHHHTNTPEFTIGNTKLITNQLGYVQQNEHRFFKSNKFVLI
jgi:predicted phosphohydrolase